MKINSHSDALIKAADNLIKMALMLDSPEGIKLDDFLEEYYVTQDLIGYSITGAVKKFR